MINTAGNIFFSDESRGVWGVGAAGRRYLLAGSDDGLHCTEGIALRPDGTLIVGERTSHEVFGVAKRRCVSHGSIYITDSKACKLYIYRPNRELELITKFRVS